MQAETPFQTGCAFWPRRKGPFFLAGGFGVWDRALWDEAEVADELGHLADLGFDFTRVGVPWEALQPDAAWLRGELMDRVVALLDAAGTAGLTVQLVLLGRMGGTLWVPRWLLASDPEAPSLRPMGRHVSEGWEPPLPLADFYTAPALVRAQGHGWAELGRHLAAHPALAALDGGAGGLLTAVPPRHPDDVFGWWEAVMEEIPDRVQRLYGDGPGLLVQTGLPPLAEWREAVGRLALAVPPHADLPRWEEQVAWVAFVLGVAHTLAHAPVGCTALGLPSGGAWDEEAQARFVTEVLPRLFHASVPFLCGSVWADAPAPLHALPPFDQAPALRHAGLLRADGREKEAARSWRTFNAARGTLGTPQGEGRLNLDEAEWQRRCTEPGWVMQLFRREAEIRD